MKFMTVIGTQRTGTTLLRSILGTHPKIKTYGEVFLNRHVHMKEAYYYFYQEHIKTHMNLIVPSIENNAKLFEAYLKYMESLSLKNDPEYIMFDCKYNFLLGTLVPGEFNYHSLPFLLMQFKSQNVKMIHLIRQNLLETYVSSLLSVANQVWATTSLDRIKHRSTVVNTEDLVALLHRRKSEQNYFVSLLQNHGVLLVKYEGLIDKDNYVNNTVMQEISNHIGMENLFEKKAELVKIAPPLNQSIENYDEVFSVLRGTEFESMAAV